jgi:hypothetical protein
LVEFVQRLYLLKDFSHLGADHFGLTGKKPVPEIAIALA